MDVSKSIDNDHCTVVLSDKFTFLDHSAFQEVLNEFNRRDIQKITLDMTRLLFIDSYGLGQLLLAQDAAGAQKKTLIIKGAAGQVKKMFGIAHFETIFTLQD